MAILRILKSIYTGKNNLLNHISIFSLLGIMTLALNNVFSSYLGNIYSGFLGFAPSDKLELSLDLIVGLMLWMFFTGYSYNFANSCYKKNDGLPVLSLFSFSVFLKMLPIISVWTLYVVFIALLGGVFIPFTSPYFYVFYSLIICTLPFVNMIYVIFAKDFIFTPKFFSPKILFKVIDKTLGDVIFLAIKILLASVLPAVIVYLFFYFAKVEPSQYIKLGLRLLGVCSGVYFVTVIQYLYQGCLVEIVQCKIEQI